MLTQSQSNFLKLAADAAVRSEAATKVPAKLTLAQAIFESGWGGHMPGNNCFGIKFHGIYTPQYVPTFEYVNGVKYFQNLAFEKYPTLELCFEDHARLISAGAPYQPAWKKFLLDGDADALILAIGPIYATQPGYAQTILTFANSSTVQSNLPVAVVRGTPAEQGDLSIFGMEVDAARSC